MTEYTPTTEEVREAWNAAVVEGAAPRGALVDSDWGDQAKTDAQFDRWLAARDAERDRQVAERAWAEGYRQGYGDRHDDFHVGYVPSGFEQDTLNAYRKEATGD